MVTIGVSACSSTQKAEEQTPLVLVDPPIIVEPEQEQESVSPPINNGLIHLPVVDDAQIFAEFSDALPAIVNYFTRLTEAEIIDFYQQEFGSAYSQERKRDRLTLKYQKNDEKIRVVISPQNRKRQVDVMIESNTLLP
ncbi:hypothetical protein FCS21_13670 [Colwellia ponticola]|uniref:Uncharacterized protein n=2 Tax=Colwellia ponticola TaxID=2304625 RepID=A0A8H2PLR2_9GAMM|nr:hypothetical protein FCS21_13670 [Colwellia ponticola]